MSVLVGKGKVEQSPLLAGGKPRPVSLSTSSASLSFSALKWDSGLTGLA